MSSPVLQVTEVPASEVGRAFTTSAPGYCGTSSGKFAGSSVTQTLWNIFSGGGMGAGAAAGLAPVAAGGVGVGAGVSDFSPPQPSARHEPSASEIPSCRNAPIIFPPPDSGGRQHS